MSNGKIYSNSVQKFSVEGFRDNGHRNNRAFILFVMYACTVNRKINGTPKGVYLSISKLHSILAVANLLAYNNK